MIELVLKGGLSYLLGSIMGSLAVARLTGGLDIRTLGSGNAGATNALRTQGKKVGLTVLLIDLAKGWIATGVIAPFGLSSGLQSPTSAALAPWCAPVCGIAVIAFGYVGLASMLAAVALVAAVALRSSPGPLLAFAVLAALLIFYTHRSNIARMRQGTESRARRLWLLGTRRGSV